MMTENLLSKKKGVTNMNKTFEEGIMSQVVRTETDENGDICGYNEHGNVIHYKKSNGREKWYEYDKNGKLIKIIKIKKVKTT